MLKLLLPLDGHWLRWLKTAVLNPRDSQGTRGSYQGTRYLGCLQVGANKWDPLAAASSQECSATKRRQSHALLPLFAKSFSLQILLPSQFGFCFCSSKIVDAKRIRWFFSLFFVFSPSVVASIHRGDHHPLCLSLCLCAAAFDDEDLVSY